MKRVLLQVFAPTPQNPNRIEFPHVAFDFGKTLLRAVIYFKQVNKHKKSC